MISTDLFSTPRKQIGRISAAVKEVHRTSFSFASISNTKGSRINHPFIEGDLLLRPFTPIFISSERSRSVERRTKMLYTHFFRLRLSRFVPDGHKILHNGKKN